MTDHTDSPAFEVVDDASPWFVAELEAHIDAFNVQTTCIDDARLMSIALRGNDGGLYAGLHGHTWGGTCQIKLLWIAADHRG